MKSYYILFMLFVVYVFNQWDRYIFNYLYNVPTKDKSHSWKNEHSLAFSTGLDLQQYSLLSGIYFTLVFAFCSLFVGRLADIYSRRNIIVFGLLVWSLAVVGMGFAETFWHLLLSRMVLGVGQAFSAPPSYSLISDIFDVSQLGRANGFFSFGIYVGGGLSSLSLLLNSGVGWRWTCWIVGGLGVVLAGVVFVTVQEPARKGKKTAAGDQAEKLTLVETLKAILGSKTVILIFLASAMRFCGGYIIGTYNPTFFKRIYPSRTDEFAVIMAFVTGIGGPISAFGGGMVADRWAQAEPRARMWVPAIGALLAIPFMAGVTLIPELNGAGFYLSMACLFGAYVTAECWFGPTLALLQKSVAPAARGFATASFIFFTTLIGSAAPAIMAPIDKYFSGTHSDGSVDHTDPIRYEILIAVTLSYLGCACLFVLTGATLKTSREEEQMTQTLLSDKPGSDDV